MPSCAPSRPCSKRAPGSRRGCAQRWWTSGRAVRSNQPWPKPRAVRGSLPRRPQRRSRCSYSRVYWSPAPSQQSHPAACLGSRRSHRAPPAAGACAPRRPSCCRCARTLPCPTVSCRPPLQSLKGSTVCRLRARPRRCRRCAPPSRRTRAPSSCLSSHRCRGPSCWARGCPSRPSRPPAASLPSPGPFRRVPRSTSSRTPSWRRSRSWRRRRGTSLRRPRWGAPSR